MESLGKLPSPLLHLARSSPLASSKAKHAGDGEPIVSGLDRHFEIIET